MKPHSFNKEYREKLDLLAHGRGRRGRLNTRFIPNKRKKLIEKERVKEINS